MLDSFQNVLVLAAHADDGELGLGGTISKMVEMGTKVTYVVFCSSQESVLTEATRVLGIKADNLIRLDNQVRKLNYVRQEILEWLIKFKNNNDFDLVFTPSSFDTHQDHSIIAQETLRAFKKTSIFGYELIWNNLNFHTNCFSILDQKHIDRKVESVKYYAINGDKDYLSPDFITSLARTRGVQVGKIYAEAFEVVRLILK